MGPNWDRELKLHGWDKLLKNRLDFHGGFTVQDVVSNTGRSQHTVEKHLQKLVDEGIAEWWRIGEKRGIKRKTQ